MIKFRCSACEGKIGVPDHFAGKSVRCPKCHSAEPVPDPELEVEEPYVPEEEGGIMWDEKFVPQARSGDRQADQPEPDSGREFPIKKSRKALGNDQAAASAEDHFGLPVDSQMVFSADDFESAEAPSLCPHCNKPVQHGDYFCRYCRGMIAMPNPEILVEDEAQEVEKPRKRKRFNLLAGSGKGVRVLLTLGLGFGTALGGAALWAWIVCAIGYEFGMVAWILGVLIGIVISISAGNNSGWTRAWTVLMAVFCILMGKYYIASWYVMPMMQKEGEKLEFRQEIQDKLTSIPAPAHVDPADAKPLTEEEIQAMLDDPDIMFAIMCHNLKREEKWGEEFAEQLISFHNGEYSPSSSQQLKFEKEEKRVQILSENTPLPLKRLAILYRHAETTGYKDQLAEEFEKTVKGLITTGPVGMAIAFVAAFSWFDILWIILAVSSAYKISARDSFTDD